MLHVWTQGDVSAGIVGICQDIVYVIMYSELFKLFLVYDN